MVTSLHWTAYLTAIAIPIIALVAAWVAFRQWQIARNKLKLDLFEKRMAVYDAARKALGAVAARGRLTRDEEVEYLTGVSPAKWLFGRELAKYLDETLWHRLVDLELHNSMSQGEPSEERSHHVRARAETMKWLVAQYSELDRQCAGYLTLEH